MNLLRKLFFASSLVLPRAIKDRLKERFSFSTWIKGSMNISKKDKPLTFDELKTLIKKDELGYRPYHSLCLLYATLQAQKMNLHSITVIELGVATGSGILNLCEISSIFTKVTGIKIDVYGFDTGMGLPEIVDYRDHPEIWRKSEYEMGDRQQLLTKMKSFEPAIRTDIYFGNVKNTVRHFVSNVLSTDSPIGFISVDLDLYSSTKTSLQLLTGNAGSYLPAILMYVDDTETLITYNSRCGEKLAIQEFNSDQHKMFIEKKLVRRNFSRKSWHERIYVCHVLDHPVRNGEMDCDPMEINIEHY